MRETPKSIQNSILASSIIYYDKPNKSIDKNIKNEPEKNS